MQTPSQVTQMDPNLKLVNFNQVSPEQIKAQVQQAIESGNAFLDGLDNETESPKQAQQALSDIIEFDHIGLGLDRSWGILSHLNLQELIL